MQHRRLCIVATTTYLLGPSVGGNIRASKWDFIGFEDNDIMRDASINNAIQFLIQNLI